MNVIAKKRALRLSEELSEQQKEQLLQNIKMNQDIVHGEVIATHLLLQYTLQQTSLKHILIALTPVLKKLDIKLRRSFTDKLRMEFIYFIEANCRDNINHPSGWSTRLQNIYLELSEQTAEDHNSRKSGWKNLTKDNLTKD